MTRALYRVARSARPFVEDILGQWDEVHAASTAEVAVLDLYMDEAQRLASNDVPVGFVRFLTEHEHKYGPVGEVA